MKIGPIQPGGVKTGVAGVAGAPSPFKHLMDGVTPRIPQMLKTPLFSSSRAPAALASGLAGSKRAALPRATANVKQHEAVAASMQRAREHMNSTAQNLTELRAHHAETAHEQRQSRLVDLICQELRAEFGGDMKLAANSDKPTPFKTGSGAAISSAGQQHPPERVSSPASIPPEANAKVASAVELIEKIETFMRSQRPGLAITLEGSLGARVEIERLGPKEVAVRVVGKNGPPSAEDIGRIRDEIRARGLKVGALSVA